MKLLVVGDFHGKFPKKFENMIKKQKIDLVVSLGDYAPFAYRKLWFEYCYGKDVELWEIIGKKKYGELVRKDLDSAEGVLKKLNKLPVPVFTVLGNIDWPEPDDIMDLGSKGKTMPNWDEKEMLVKRMKKYKNIRRIDYKAVRFGDYVFVGMRGHSAPGKPRSKAFSKHKKILEMLFKKYRKENKEGRVVFVSHIIPYDTKLDKISMTAHKKVRGKHYGSKLVRWAIKKFQPLVAFGGHIHEGMGKDKIGETVVINPGAAHEGHGVVLELVDMTKN